MHKLWMNKLTICLQKNDFHVCRDVNDNQCVGS